MTTKLEELEASLKAAEPMSEAKVDLMIDYAWELGYADVKRSTDISEEALEIAGKIGYKKGVAFAKGNIGIYSLGNPGSDIEHSKSYLYEALVESRNSDDREREGWSLMGLSILDWGMGNLETGFEHAMTALDLFKNLENSNGTGWLHCTLGGYYFDYKDYEQSSAHFHKGLVIFEELQNQNGLSRANNGIGNAELSRGNYESAAKFINKALNLARDGGHQFTESRSLNDLGHIYRGKGDLDAAHNYYTQSLDMRRIAKYSQGIITSLLDLGSLKMELKQFDEAESMMNEALDISLTIKAKVKTSRAQLLLHELHRVQGNYELALTHYIKHHELDKKIYQDDADTQLSNLKAAHQVDNTLKEAEINRLKNIELKEKNDKLEQTLKKLNAAQAQLIQSGKTAALGKLVAGIVHEFNTPTAVITSSMDVLSRALKKLPDVINEEIKAESKNGRNGLTKVLSIIEQNSNANQIATDRIIAIVSNLKNFTRLDEAPVQRICIQESIDTVIELLKSETPDNVTIIKKYGGTPKILVTAADINHVFMNLLLNAIHASKNGGKIVIKTGSENQQIFISITDNGRGIQPEKFETLFEPGFTEKDSRVQMRSGLYTSSNIIHNHNGSIEVKSVINKGTTFTVTLPAN